MGVSVELDAYAWRLDQLRQVPAHIRFISAEPLLGPLNDLRLDGISWVITGGESGGPAHRALVEKTKEGLRPKTDALIWVRQIRDLCFSRGVGDVYNRDS
jgi:protein gp37